VPRGLRTGLLVLLAAVLAAGVGPAQAPAKSRAVSLRMLQEALRSAQAEGRTPQVLRDLCGLTRLEGYTYDPAGRDVILMGKVDPTAPALHTDDLVVALRSAWYKYARREGRISYYANPGCSIDPEAAVVRRLTELGAQVGAAGSSLEIEGVLTQWEAVATRPQHVRVMGVPNASHFAQVMVSADYLLKRVVDGSAPLSVPGVTSLVDRMLSQTKEELERDGALHGPVSSMSRFWFHPGRNRYELDGDTVRLLQCPVTLLTEEEYLSARGVAGKGRPEPVAQGFATDFGAHYAEIAQERPIYQELEGLFRLVAIAKLMRYQRVNLKLDYLLGRYPVARVAVPARVPGVSHIARLEQTLQTESGPRPVVVSMPSCGGVSIDTTIRPEDFVVKRPPAPRPTSAKPAPRGAGRGAKPTRSTQAAPAPPREKPVALKSRPSPKALFWDY
jgi:hypothetical protein